MVEIQCSSCHTRYRIDERVLPEDTPTFKCSRCGHVFSVEPRRPKAGESAGSRAAESARQPAASAERQPAAEPTVKTAAPKSAGPKVRRSLKIVPPPQAPREIQPPEPGTTAPATDSYPETVPESEPEARAEIVPAEINPLERPFSHRIEEPDPDENFDFSAEIEEDEIDEDETREEVGDEDAWEVGESGLHFTEPHEHHVGVAEDAGATQGIEPPVLVPGRVEREAEKKPAGHASAPWLGSPVHSSGFFLACFFFVALAFGAVSLLIAGQPAASASLLAGLPAIGDRFVDPAPAAVQIALRDIHAGYQSINGQRQALVITGQALSVGNQPLHEVQIAVSLLDASQRELARQEVYCGNSLSGRMISQMTPRELDFYQKLGPPKSFVLQPSGLSPFVTVFVEPAAGAGSFAVQVERAARDSSGSSPPSEAPASAARHLSVIPSPWPPAPRIPRCPSDRPARRRR